MSPSRDDRAEFVVGPEHAGERADKLIVLLLAQAGRPATRADVQRWMAEGNVLIDGQLPRRARAVAVGATICVTPGRPLTSSATPDSSVPFTVVYEDEHLLVVDKPAKVVVHPARGHRTGTLVSGLLAHAHDLSSLAAPDPRDREGHLRPGIVHRLDNDTSGLIVVAKTAATREGLKDLFARHDIERCYLALVVGRARRASYDTPYGRDPASRLRFTSKLPADRAGVRRAITHIEPVEQIGPAAMVRCRLDTGRTHQIRVHLAEQAGTPVLGDALYGRRCADEFVRELGERLGRHALHAAVLGFVHPISREQLRWESPLPDELEAALKALRAHASDPSR